MNAFLRYMLLPFRAPLLPILVLVSAYLGLDWTMGHSVVPGQAGMETLLWGMECLQAVLVVVVCTLPDLLLRQVSSLMAASRVVSLVFSLLIVISLGIYMLHLQMLTNVLILGSSVLLARLDMVRVRLVPPPWVAVLLLVVLVLGGASLGRLAGLGDLGPLLLPPGWRT
ncbi:MAG: hypothetical protein FJ083_06090 [Cyanobacteria bacterium K_Offshore_surface_m2_239]|nr:hypothetical protein [Cyanobacteria bacterium K_Offshore_surface_m2_239]